MMKPPRYGNVDKFESYSEIECSGLSSLLHLTFELTPMDIIHTAWEDRWKCVMLLKEGSKAQAQRGSGSEYTNTAYAFTYGMMHL